MSEAEDLARHVSRHYGMDDLVAGVEAALAAHASDRLSVEELGHFDELHVGGRAATKALAERLPPGAGRRLLDVGSGIGGAARLLASAHGWRVTGIDLTEPYCRVARYLTARLGLAERAGFTVANGLALPFADGTFQAATSVHAAMNIPDKAALYREVRRVLAPGAPFALYDLLQGQAGPPRFPVPWADTPATSFLADPDELIGTLEASGFQVIDREDRGGIAKAAFQQGPKPNDLARAGVRLFLGGDYKTKMANLKGNILEDRVTPWLVVCRA